MMTFGSASEPDDFPVVHITEAFGAGVARAIGTYVKCLSSHPQRLLARTRREAMDLPLPDDSREVVDSLPTFVANYIRHWRPSAGGAVVHAHSTIAGALVRAFRPRDALAVVYSPHGLGYLGARPRAVRLAIWLFERALRTRSDIVVAVGHGEATELMDLGHRSDRIYVVPHAVRLAQHPLSADQRKQTIVTVGRVCLQKAPEVVAQVALAAKRSTTLSSYKFIWVGAGDPHLEDMLRSAGVEVTGWLAHENVEEQVATANVLLHSAIFEGLPIAVLEAMAVGTPVVGPALPALRELDSVVTYDDVEGAVASLERLVSSAQNWNQASRQSMEEIRSNFTLQAQSAALNLAYLDAITYSNSRRGRFSKRRPGQRPP